MHCHCVSGCLRVPCHPWQTAGRVYGVLPGKYHASPDACHGACPCMYPTADLGSGSAAPNLRGLMWRGSCCRQAAGGVQEDQPVAELPGQRDRRADGLARAAHACALPRLQAHAHPGGLPGRQLQDYHDGHGVARSGGLPRCALHLGCTVSNSLGRLGHHEAVCSKGHQSILEDAWSQLEGLSKS